MSKEPEESHVFEFPKITQIDKDIADTIMRLIGEMTHPKDNHVVLMKEYQSKFAELMATLREDAIKEALKRFQKSGRP